LVLSALEYIGKEEAQDEKLQSEIAKKLNSKEKLELEQAAQAYPKWLREIVERIAA
jgi:heme oxygenase